MSFLALLLLAMLPNEPARFLPGEELVAFWEYKHGLNGGYVTVLQVDSRGRWPHCLVRYRGGGLAYVSFDHLETAAEFERRAERFLRESRPLNVFGILLCPYDPPDLPK